MDILTTHHVSLNAAIWARAHRYNVTSVAMVRQLQLIAELEKQRDAVQDKLDNAEAEIKSLVEVAEFKQRKSDGN